MKTTSKTSLIIALAFVAAAAQGGGGITGGATEWTQILNNGELAAQVSQQIKTYERLSQQLAIFAANDRLLNSHNFQITGPQLLSELHRAMVTDQTVSYVGSSLNDEFEHQYPDYRQYSLDRYGVVAVTNRDFDQWNAQNSANVKAALDTININRDQVLTEGQMLDMVARQAKTTESKKAIMQIGNDLALTQVHQARRMENLLQTQIALQSNYLAAEQAQEVRQQADQDDTSKRRDAFRKAMEERFEKGEWRRQRENTY